MNSYRNALPQLEEGIFFTDGGMETTLIFDEGYELPCFAAFVLLEQKRGLQSMRTYYERYAKVALAANCGFVLESPTWRANRDWGQQLGYDRQQLDAVNHRSIAFLEDIRKALQQPGSPMVISGCIGPRGDGYTVAEIMNPQQAADYHREQIASFADSAADMVSAFTLSYPEEAIGITLAARECGLPAVISFTTETDGRLPNGQLLREAIERVDRATDRGPAYYMINCAHPDHFRQALAAQESWTRRIRGIRANASRMSHAELDQAEELDAGDPVELGQLYRELQRDFPHFTVLGGCCGTDHRHIEQVRHACC
jgi:S-methylmethionine-dependent homocysteine/selenocysteine methylase